MYWTLYPNRLEQLEGFSNIVFDEEDYKVMGQWDSMSDAEKNQIKESAEKQISNLSENWNYLKLRPETWRERLAVIRMNQEMASLFDEAEEAMS